MSLDAVALTPHWSRCHIYLWFPPPVLGEISGNLVIKSIIITSSAYSQLDTLILMHQSYRFQIEGKAGKGAGFGYYSAQQFGE